ncbi:MAG: sugar phosphate isomerase/epimerase [Verrucomicrobiales bacterium]
MRLSLNTSTIKPQPLLDKIRLAAEAGFEGIELWITEIYEFIGRGGEVRDVENALADCGLAVPCCIALRHWADFDGREHDLALDEARRRMDLAARLGAPYIVATPPLDKPGTDGLAERYRELLAIGRAAGVKPTFEYISFFASAYSLPQAWDIVQAAGDADATLILDAFHTWNSGSPQDLIRQIPAGKISHYHIDDAAPGKPPRTQTDPDRTMPGDGPINLRHEVGLLREIGYQGWVSLELFNADLWAKDPREVLKAGIDRLREIVALRSCSLQLRPPSLEKDIFYFSEISFLHIAVRSL